MKQQKKKSLKLGAISLAVFVLAMVILVFALSRTVAEVGDVAVMKTPEAILANAGVSESEGITLQVSYFDQEADECVDMYDVSKRAELKSRQFGWNECGYYNKQLEQGLVDFYLGEDYLPVAKGGKLTPNKGLTDMSRWYSEVEGKSKGYIGLIKMDYNHEGAEFSFHQKEFYPLDEVEYSVGEVINDDGHNHLFTMNFAVPFTALLSGDEAFSITADDDTFVYVGDELVIDMGGIHDVMTGSFKVNENGEIYSGLGEAELAYSGVKLINAENSIVRVFHADRDEEESTFEVRLAGMSLGVVNSEFANGDDGGVQIAYDPTDPSYVGPLGESTVVKPDNTRGFVVLATIEGVIIVVLSVLIVVSARFLIRRKM